MILFLNFAPLSFGGGAERWIVSVAEELAKGEDVVTVDVDSEISDVYAQLVLKRKFDKRLELKNKSFQQWHITWTSLIPFSSAGDKIRQSFKEARIIYSKFELNEALLLFYFGGPSILKKTVFGLHSPFLYRHRNLTFLESLHNSLSSSFVFKMILTNCRTVHALNSEQEMLLRNDFQLNNVVCIPNFIEKKPALSQTNTSNSLLISFISELSLRKGADILLEVIKNSPPNLIFRVAGDGPLKPNFEEMRVKNLEYLGYLSSKKIDKVLSDSDVMFMPSYAESFSLACLEALSHGLTIVGSDSISLSSINKYLHINQTGSAGDYLQILKKLYAKKKSGVMNLTRKRTWKEVNETFSKKHILNLLNTQLFKEALI